MSYVKSKLFMKFFDMNKKKSSALSIFVFVIVLLLGFVLINPKIMVEADSGEVAQSVIKVNKKDETVRGSIQIEENMQNGQVEFWGNSGQGWALLKKFNISQKEITDKKCEFNLDLKKLKDKENKVPFNYNDDTVNLYIKFIYNDSATNQKKSSERTINASNINEGQSQSNIMAAVPETLEIAMGIDYRNSPCQVNVGVQVIASAKITGQNQEGYTIAVIGESGKIIGTPVAVNASNEFKATLTPEQRGIFWLALRDSGGNIVTKRKLYVNSKEYYQITGLSLYPSEENDTTISLTSRKFTLNSSIPSSTVSTVQKVTIGDPYVWSKEIMPLKVDFNYNSLNLESSFNFNYGNYYVQASLKNENSIEYEDAVGQMYNQRAITNGLRITPYISQSGNNSEPIKATNFSIGQSYRFLSEPTTPDNDLQYIFLISDGSKGFYPVTGYTDINYYDWSPPSAGNYTIIAKVRRKTTPNNGTPGLNNSFEAQASYTVHIVGNGDNITIDSAKINGNDISSTTSVKTHNLYTLTVACSPDSNIMYRAYTIHDGVFEYLSDFTSVANSIPFYPKSFGSYKLVILAKNATAGAYQACKSYDITVTQN
jgi:hypothetical protein